MMYDMYGRRRESTITREELSPCSSLHGFVRTMERTGLNERRALRMIRNAWARGKRPEQLPLAKQQKYLAYYGSLTETGPACLRVYAGYLFIFSSAGVLITMYALPESFYRKRLYDGKECVRKARKYVRLCTDSGYDALEA